MSVSYCSLLARNFFVEKERKKRKLLTHVQLFATPWTVALQAPLPIEFSRQEYWNRLPFPSPGHLPNPGIEPRSPTLQVDSLPSEPPEMPIQTSSLNLGSQLATAGNFCSHLDHGIFQVTHCPQGHRPEGYISKVEFFF